ncbi:MAG: ATP-binding protein [Saprospiraceae bacterium]
MRRASLNLKAGHYELAKEQFEQLVKDSKVAGRIDAFNAVLVGQFANLYTQSSVKPSKVITDNFLPVVDRIIKKNENQFNLDLLDAQRLSTILGVYNQDQSRVVNGLQQILAIKDTLQNQEKLKVTNELFVKYQTKEKEKELEISALALAKKTTQRNALIGAALALLIILTVLALHYQQKKKYATTLEEEVEKRTADLKAANKSLLQSNEELERYTYIASHDLKEPLRDIINFTNLIKQKKLIKNEEALQYFDFIEKGAFQTNKIVQDVVDFSDIRNVKVTIDSVNPTEIIDEINQNIVKHFDTKQIIFSTNQLPNSIQSNKNLLSMILKSIIENGIKYNNNDIVNIDISYSETNGKHQFKIQDNGIGIDKKYFDLIFKMFKRLHKRSKYSGSGIGLAICKRSVDYLGGMITLESEVGKGSLFIVELPNVIKSQVS